MSGKYKRKQEDDPQALSLLGAQLGFSEENIDVLRLALTHSTYFEGSRHGSGKTGDDDNQRLEFLGDAVLDLVVGEYLYHRYPDAREGELSKMRAYLVCEASLSAIAQKLGLEKRLRMGRGAESGGDRYRPSVQADAFEAVIGAVFLTQGYQQTSRLLLAQLGEQMDKLSPDDYEDKKSLLQELVQSKTPHGVIYKVLAHSGPDHQPHFESGVYCGKLLLGRGEGGSKKESEVAAAGAALKDKDSWIDDIV